MTAAELTGWDLALAEVRALRADILARLDPIFATPTPNKES